MSRARDFADLAGSADAGGIGGSNMVINGSMNVSQRGTSSTGLHTSGYYTVDRFSLVFGNEDELRVTMSQNSVTDLDGFANSLKVQTTTAESAIAADESYYIINRYEGQDFQHLKYGTSNALSTTLSFYVKSSVTGTFAVAIYQTDGNDIIGSTYTINSANTWEKKEITFAGNTLAAIVDDNTNAIMIDWFLAAGSNFTSVDNTSWGGYEAGKLAYGHGTNAVATTTNATWEMTGVKWEVGSSATPFDHSESYGETLERCKRYYQRTTTGGNAYTNLSVVGCYSTGTDQRGTIPFTTEMRTGPALSTSGNLMVLGLGGGLASISAGDGISTHHAGIRVNTNSNLTAGQVAILRGNNDTTAHIQFDAEL